jgi:hypothetical protein
MAIRVDLSAWPFINCSVVDSVTIDEMREYLSTLDQIVARGEKFAMLFNVVNKLSIPDRGIVRMQADWFKRNATAARDRWVGLALVFSAPVLRFLMTSLLLVTKLPMPYTLVESAADGARWLENRLVLSGLPVPPQLKALQGA